MVLIPAKDTPSDTQTRPTPETVAGYHTAVAAGRLAPLAGVIDLRVADEQVGDERVIADAF